jgi:hypothetical protein
MNRNDRDEQGLDLTAICRGLVEAAQAKVITPDQMVAVATRIAAELGAAAPSTRHGLPGLAA